MKHIMTTFADVGAICINGIKFSTGSGDGMVDVFYNETLPDGYEYVTKDVWIDLRDANTVIWKTDTKQVAGRDTIITTDSLNALAVLVARNKEDGDICLVKYF